MHVSGHIRKRNRKNGKPSYQIIIELPPDPVTGHRIRKYKTIIGNKKQAEIVKRKMMDEIENHVYIEDNNITVSEWIKQWFELYLKDLSPTTLNGYSYQIKHYILNQDIGKIKLQDLTTSAVQAWINTLSENSPVSNKPMSAKTVKNIYHNLCAAIEKAVALELVKKNVCKNVSLPKIKKHIATVYDEKEVSELLYAANGTDMELPIMIAVNLGLRRGELLALKWKHIDFEHNSISIEENLVEVNSTVSPDRILTKSPKSQSGQRVIPISSFLSDYLKKAYKDYMLQKMKMGTSFHDNGYVIHQENGNPYKPNSFSSKFNDFLKANNLKHIRFHDLRHTNATLMLTQGISPKVAQMRLGHSDFSTTMNTYSHVLESVETNAAERIENAIFSNIMNLERRHSNV